MNCLPIAYHLLLVTLPPSIFLPSLSILSLFSIIFHSELTVRSRKKTSAKFDYFYPCLFDSQLTCPPVSPVE